MENHAVVAQWVALATVEDVQDVVVNAHHRHLVALKDAQRVMVNAPGALVIAMVVAEKHA